MTRKLLSAAILRYTVSRAICIATVPELFHISGRVLRSDELERMPKRWLVALLAKCTLVVEDFCQVMGEQFDSSDGQLIESFSTILENFPSLSVEELAPALTPFLPAPINGSNVVASETLSPPANMLVTKDKES